MNYATLRYRIKDSTTRNKLLKMASSCNFVWNYCNEANQESWKKFGKPLSAFDLNNLTYGCSKELGLHSQSVQAICEEYAKSCNQRKKRRLAWRSNKKSLGWIPFKLLSIKVKSDELIYNKLKFKLWVSKEIPSKVRFGSFSQDSKGNWFVNLVVEKAIEIKQKTKKEVGVDLGLKTLVTLSDGIQFTRENLTKKFEKELATAQRAKKKKRIKNIYIKIKNKRKDWNHKVSTMLVNSYDKIVVGDVSSSKLIKTRMAKSVSDAGWFDFKQMLAYKAIRLGVEMKVVKESFSTVTCSSCLKRTGPSGLSALGVRDWVCSCCGVSHNRDVNAAKNILQFSLSDMTGQLRESPSL